MTGSRWRVRAAALGSALVAGLAATLMGAPANAQPAAASVVEVPVSFTVHNTNRTPVLCASDGKTYTVRGTIIEPSSAVRRSAATLMLHAVTWGQYYWNFKGVPGYDFAHQMAQRGHTIVAIDRLGYGASDRPPGLATCYGSEADVAHQIIQQLRNGTYHAKGSAPSHYAKVSISGSSVGGLMSNIEAYTFHDVDGVINMSWGDLAVTPLTGLGATSEYSRCLAGGDPGTPGYSAFFKYAKSAFYFQSATPAVRAAVPDPKPDPCGQVLSIPQGLAADTALLETINVPVQVIFGSADPIFGPQPLAAEQQALRYLGSPAVTRTMIPAASHYPLIESHHLDVVTSMDAFLSSYGS